MSFMFGCVVGHLWRCGPAVVTASYGSIVMDIGVSGYALGRQSRLINV